MGMFEHRHNCRLGLASNCDKTCATCRIPKANMHACDAASMDYARIENKIILGLHKVHNLHARKLAHMQPKTFMRPRHNNKSITQSRMGTLQKPCKTDAWQMCSTKPRTVRLLTMVQQSMVRGRFRLDVAMTFNAINPAKQRANSIGTCWPSETQRKSTQINIDTICCLPLTRWAANQNNDSTLRREAHAATGSRWLLEEPSYCTSKSYVSEADRPHLCPLCQLPSDPREIAFTSNLVSAWHCLPLCVNCRSPSILLIFPHENKSGHFYHVVMNQKISYTAPLLLQLLSLICCHHPIRETLLSVRFMWLKTTSEV